MHKQNGILKRHHARENERAIFAEAVSTRHFGCHSRFAQQLCGDDLDGQDRRLRMLRELKFFRRTFKAECTDGIAERCICFGKALFRKIVAVEQILSHTDDLRALPRKNKC